MIEYILDVNEYTLGMRLNMLCTVVQSTYDAVQVCSCTDGGDSQHYVHYLLGGWGTFLSERR